MFTATDTAIIGIASGNSAGACGHIKMLHVRDWTLLYICSLGPSEVKYLSVQSSMLSFSVL